MEWSRNTGKYRIQRDLLSITEPLRVLDVGSVGVGPLDLWRSMPLDSMPITVVGVDNDADGVKRASALGLDLSLECVSAYDLASHFGPESFDLVVSTQVLEHVARPDEFLTQTAAVLKPGGRFWCTLDSGHFSTGHAGDPLWKRAARPLAARLTEKHYDFGLTREALEPLVRAAPLEITELMFCNLGPVKPMMGALDSAGANAAMELWCALEIALQPAADPSAFRGIYVAATKPA